MGGALSNAANSVGSVIGNALAAPFKSVFNRSCEDICSGAWDVACFIEHICITDMVRLLLIFILCYITFVFFYLLFKLGICQCIARSLCKMCWGACEAYCFLLQYITCSCWHKIKNTKRVYRGHRHRYRDVESGYIPTDESSFFDHGTSALVRKRKSLRERRMNRYPRSSHPAQHGLGRSRHYVRSKTRQVSFRHRGRSQRRSNPKLLRIRNLGKHRRKMTSFKRRRLG
ncbi:hypothetical protein Nepgr_015977 [Nepenthes gracilis]|uniref:Uncharacterized protein n=1 Tax=Nepenthes gracilis TaxID=150966 RepID=A0AAD3SPM0_NEPGR|nr:hypothetical protein Nepgr_015977 [Nepenthes gracilis]